MPVVATVQVGTVTHVWGTAVLRLPNGKTRPIKVGDVINQGDMILTAQNSIVEIRKPEAGKLVAADPRTPAESIEQIITGLERGDPEVVPAAGPASNGELEPAIRVGRITEGIGSGALTTPGFAGARPKVGEFPTDANPAGGIAAPTPPPPNQPPSALTTPANGAEDASIPVRLGGSDPDGSVTGITITAVPPGARLALPDGTPVAVGHTLTPAQASSLVFTPPADFTGSTSIGFTVTDDQGAVSPPASAPITVTPVNDPPVGRPDAASTSEDATAAGNVITGLGGVGVDTDADGDALTVTGVSAGGTPGVVGAALVGAYGSLTLNASGAYVYTPGAAAQALPVGASASDVFSYTVSDGNGGSSTTTLTISLTGVNDPPNARDDLASTPINVPIAAPVLANDGDPDSAPLVVTTAALANPAQGSVAINPDGSLAFTPAVNVTGPVTLSYTVRDSQGATDTASVTVFVGPNTPPDSADSRLTGIEDTPLVLSPANFAFTDADAGQSLAAVRIDTLPGAGRLLLDGQPIAAGAVINLADLAAGRLAFVPAPNATGTDHASFTFSVQDSFGAFDPAPNRITVDLGGVNDAPVAVNDSATTPEDTPISFVPAALLGNDVDVDGQPLAIASVQSPVNGTVAIVAGNVVFTPAANYTGPASFAYTVSDGQGGTSTATVNVTVTPANDPPVNNVPAAQTTAEDSPLVFSAANGNALSVADADGGSLTVTVAVTHGSFTLGSTAGVGVTGNGSGSVQVSGTAAAINAALAGSSYASSADYHGPASLTLTTSDGTASDIDTVALTVTPVVDIAGDALTTPEETPIAIGVLANDSFENAGRTITTIDGTAVVAGGAAVAVPTGTVALDTSGQLVFSPAVNHVGPASFTYTVTSGGVSETATVNVTVTPVNDAPVALPDSVTTLEDTPVSGNLLANDGDPEATPLAVTQFTVGGTTYAAGSTAALAGVGTLTIGSTGAYTFTPAAHYTGAVPTASYVATDGALTATSTLAIAITPVNDAPLAAPDTGTTPESTPLTGNVLANDSDLDSAALSVTQFVVGGSTYAAGATATLAGVGTLTIGSTGAYTFTPAAGYNGPVPVATYTASDGATPLPATSTATLAITVSPVNDAPEPTLSVRGIGRWTFDEGSGATTRDAYNARTGTLDDTVAAPALAPVWTASHVASAGTALDFDGTGSRVALDASTTQPLMGTATLSFWIRTTQTGAGNAESWGSPAVIASEQNGLRDDIQWGAINASGQIGLGIGDAPGVFSTTRVNDGSWHQVTITRNAANDVVNVYVDGLLETTGTTSDSGYTGTINRLAGFGQNNNFDIDAAGTDQTDLDFFRGQLDDLRIYDRVLTADQVRAIQLVEAGYHDTAIANDGSPLRIELTASDYTSLTVRGLEAGMTLTDGTRSVTSTGPDSVVSLTGWTLDNLSLTGSGSATLAFDASNTVAGETRATGTQYLNVVTGTSLLGGTSAADTLAGTASADLLAGGAGADAITGAAGNDRLLGGADADTLDGGSGRDILIGGAANDAMTGGNGADVFAWSLADRGAAGGPAVDTILDFDMAAASAGGDRLDLRDLLQGSNYAGSDPGNLQNFLDFNVVGGNTEIRISSAGGFAGGSYSAGAEDQRIVLSGVDIRAGLGLGPGASDHQIIQELLTRGKLAGDGGA